MNSESLWIGTSSGNSMPDIQFYCTMQSSFGNTSIQRDYVSLMWRQWERLEEMSKQFAFEMSIRQSHAHWLVKSIMRPEKILAGWVHHPKRCAGNSPGCVWKLLTEATWDHRRARHGILSHGVMEDKLSAQGVEDFKLQLCPLMSEAGMGCSPGDWI